MPGLLLLLLLSLLLAAPAPAAKHTGNFNSISHFDNCFSQALRASQSCENDVIQYTTLMGYAGLGSEFEWLMTALMYAVMHHRRMVYLETPRVFWTYDCPEKRGWACYLSFKTCPDSVVSFLPESFSQSNSIWLRKGRKDFIYMNNNNAWIRHSIFQYAWSGRVYDSALAGSFVLNEFKPPMDAPKDIFVREMIRRIQHDNETLLEKYKLKGDILPDCDNSTLVGEMEVISVHYLYTLTTTTETAVRAINRELYPTLMSHHRSNHLPYISLQIRLTDKQKELSSEVWEWVTNTSNIVKAIQPYFYKSISYLIPTHSTSKSTVRHLYVATDECTVVSDLRSLLPDIIFVHSSCDNFTRSEVMMHKKDETNVTEGGGSSKYGTQRDYAGALKLLADIEMLRGGVCLFGLAESNVVRLSQRLQHSSNTPIGGGRFIPLKP